MDALDSWTAARRNKNRWLQANNLLVRSRRRLARPEISEGRVWRQRRTPFGVSQGGTQVGRAQKLDAPQAEERVPCT